MLRSWVSIAGFFSSLVGIDCRDGVVATLLLFYTMFLLVLPDEFGQDLELFTKIEFLSFLEPLTLSGCYNNI